MRDTWLGLLAFAAGVAMIAVGVATAKPAHAIPTNVTFMVITASDATGGHFPAGSLITETASLTNSSASGITDATPTIDLTFAPSAISYSTSSAGIWACTPSGPVVHCTDSTLTPGGSSTLPLTFSVVGNPGYNADVFYGVNDTNASNSGSGAQYTYPASVENGASYTKDTPLTGFPFKVGNDQIVSTSTAANTFTFTDGAKTIVLVIPAGALPDLTHVSVYRGNSVLWSGSLSSSSQNFVDGYAAAWTAQGQSTPQNASISVTLVVSDSAVSSGDHLYRATTSGVGPSTGNVGSGGWTVSFTEDPGFVAGRTIAATSSTSSGSIAAVIPVVPGVGRANVSRSVALPLLVGGILLVLAGTVAIGLRKRRA
jgi:hypothetical protein